MTEKMSRYVSIADRRVHFLEWGKPQSEAIIIWHGITGTAHDHVELARYLSSRYYVICPDAPGCGLSDWSTEPSDYSLDALAETALELLKHLDVHRVTWIGSSRGGLLGMYLAAGKLRDRLTCLILNDVTPSVPKEFRNAVCRHLQIPSAFDSFTAFETYLRQLLGAAAQQTLSDVEWHNLARSWSRRCDDGRLTLHFDPELIPAVVNATEEHNLWPSFDQLKIPTLLLKAELSAATVREDVDAMTRRGPRAEVINLSRVGHTPFLNRPDEQVAILRFLSQ